MKSKKGEGNESTSFLIGLLVMILILVPIIVAIIHSQQAEGAMEETLEKLIEETKKLKDGENGSVLGQFEELYALRGFDKSNPEKPKQCKDLACLCMCDQDFAVNLAGYEHDCEDETDLCKTYGKDFDMRILDRSLEAGADTVLNIQFQRKGDNIAFCRKLPCLFQSEEEAITIFNNFMESYNECRNHERNDCLCDNFDFSKLDYNFIINLVTDGKEKTIITLYDRITIYDDDIANDRKYAEQEIMEKDINKYDLDSGMVSRPAILKLGDYVGEFDDQSEEVIDKGIIQLYRTSDGKVSFVKKTDNGFAKIINEKQICQGKAKTEEEIEEGKDKESSEEPNELPEGFKKG